MVASALDDFKEEVRSRTDIVSLISDYVRLERKGNRYLGLCPFHSEKSPSFNVIPDQQFFHCFGCSASGDVFTFLMRRENLKFSEALVQLARRANLPLPQRERTAEEEAEYKAKRLSFAALEQAARIYAEQLYSPVGKVALEYLKNRGLSDESIRRFGLGWAPGHSLLLRLLSQRFPPPVLQQVDLIRKSQRGEGYYDRFFDRIIIPIHDIRGRVIGLSGRILHGDAAKYINSAEGPLFKKKENLYALHLAKDAMRAAGQAIIVEGYMDVMMPHQVGIQNVVASMGTALTPDQCKLLREQVDQVVIAYDADAAGQRATLRGLQQLYEAGCDVRILRLQGGKDPDEFIRAHGADEFRRALEKSVPLIEYRLRLALEKQAGNTPETRARAVQEVLPILYELPSETLAAQYIEHLLPNLLEMPADAIWREFRVYRKNRAMQNNPGKSWHTSTGQPLAGRFPAREEAVTAERIQSTAPQAVDPTVNLERYLLGLLVRHPEFIAGTATTFAEPFSVPVHREIWAALLPLSDQTDSSGLMGRLLGMLGEHDVRLLAEKLAGGETFSKNPVAEWQDCIERLRKQRIQRRLTELEALIKETEGKGMAVDPTLIMEWQQLLQAGRTGRSQ